MTACDDAHEAERRLDSLEMQLAQALTRCESTTVERHLEAALQHCRALQQTALVECPTCGAVGLAERIVEHDCDNFPRD